MKRSLARLVCMLPIGVCAVEYPDFAFAQSTSLVDVCTGLHVTLPTLTPVTSVVDALLGDAINLNLTNALSGADIGLSVLDTNGSLVGPSSNCGLSADSLSLTANQGITIGGGAIDGLGGTGTPASAGAVDAIAIGNGAATSAGATGALALGLRGSATAVNGIALGTDATTSAVGGVALGAGSVANRAGMNGATEALSGVAVASTAGAVSVGAVGAERQITNVAGGTQDTDAVNLRQLNSVNTSLTNQLGTVNTQITTINNTVNTSLGGVATAIGGGATYNSATNIFNGPSYNLRGVVYNDVGTALTALDNNITTIGGAISATNTSGAASASATGNDATAVGYGTRATYNNSTALGNGAVTTRANQVVIGKSSNTYTLPGVTSSASRAAQVGPTQVLTTDAAGNIASSNVDIGGMQSDISGLKKTTDDIRKEERRGIATAMAMAATPTPSAVGKTAWATNLATFSGQVAGSLAVAHRVDVDYPLTVSAAVGYSPGAPAGIRLGLAGEF